MLALIGFFLAPPSPGYANALPYSAHVNLYVINGKVATFISIGTLDSTR